MAVDTLTQSDLKALLHYNPDTGVFTNLVSRKSAAAGSTVGNKYSTNEYLRTEIKTRRYYLHRLAFLYMTGSFPVNTVDHINHDRTDNRWCNLRDVTNKNNLRNLGLPRDNTSGVIGVYWFKRTSKWMAAITVDGVQKHLGFFDKKHKAISARKRAEAKYGFHENHGRSTQA